MITLAYLLLKLVCAILIVTGLIAILVLVIWQLIELSFMRRAICFGFMALIILAVLAALLLMVIV